ncbi:MAG: hypothetical protein ACK47E_12195 [Cyclobacteriaceae bacterium]
MKTSALLFFLSISFIARSQTKAVTESGDEVLLFQDGHWEYTNKSADENRPEISVNPNKFSKSEVNTFLLKSGKVNVGVWLDPKKWSFKKAENNEDAEFEFQLKNEDMYGMLISEKLEIPIETLMNLAISNAKKIAPDIHVTSAEYRMVNSLRVLCMQMNGTYQGIKISYFGYYFSSTNGTVQFITYSSQNLFKGYLGQAELLLNGFSEIK